MPTPEETDLLRLRPNVPVISVVRITRGAGRRVLQALRIVAAANRNMFVYDDLPIPSSSATAPSSPWVMRSRRLADDALRRSWLL